MLGVCWVSAGRGLGVLRSTVRKKTLTLCSVESTFPTLLSCLPLPLFPLESLGWEQELACLFLSETHG